jgi:hypothetical protein
VPSVTTPANLPAVLPSSRGYDGRLMTGQRWEVR